MQPETLPFIVTQTRRTETPTTWSYRQNPYPGSSTRRDHACVGTTTNGSHTRNKETFLPVAESTSSNNLFKETPCKSTHDLDPNNPAAPLPVPMPNWTKLSYKDEVTIHHHGEEIASGQVDMLAHDGSMLWLIQNGGRGRALFLHRDGGRVFRTPTVTGLLDDLGNAVRNTRGSKDGR